MKSIKRMVSSRRRSSYFKVSTRGSPTTSRSPSPATSTNANTASSSTAATGTSSDEDLDLRSKLERELFELVKDRQTKNVQEFLKTNRNININIVDPENLTLLHHAVLNKDEEMVDTLLNDNFEIHIYDVLLRAIQENLVKMVIKLMKWKSIMQSKPRNKIATALFTPYAGHLEFYDDYTTPFLMAAIHGHYELLDYLYGHGERMPDLGILKSTFKWKGGAIPAADLKVSNNRINLLKGLTNPTFMAFMAGVDKAFDPILESFKLVKILRRWIEIEPEFTDVYEEILKKLEKFPVALLNNCRDSEETSLLLKRKAGYPSNTSASYPRLLLAIDYEQKEFVANTNAQDVLYQEWIGEPWITTGTASYLWKRFIIILTTVFFPFVSIFLIFTMCCLRNVKIVKYITSPKRRCMTSCVSYFYFFVVVYFMNMTEKGISNLGPPSHYLPWIVGIFVLSHFLAFLKHLAMSPKHFLNQEWNIFELISHIFWFIAIGLWIALWSREGKGGTIKVGPKKKEHIVERQWLDCNDLLLWSELMTGFASTIGGLRLLRWVLINPTLGPLQIALGKMKSEIFQFSFIFFIIIVSFSLGFQHMYRPYNKYHPEPCAFCDFPSSVEAVFYALFTMTASESPRVPAMQWDKTDKKVVNHHKITEAVGTIMFIVLHVISVTFLMNMLMGVMSSTYNRIKDNVNVEWKFGRAQLWLYYIQDSILPPPFNIYPDCLMLCTFVSWLKAFASPRTRKRACCNFNQFCFVADEEDEKTRKDRERQYPLLIRRLLQRYFRSRSSNESEDPPVSGDIKRVHKQVIELRALTTITLELHSNPNSGSQINVQKDNAPKKPSVPNIVP